MNGLPHPDAEHYSVKKDLLHQISQPLTAIANFAAASRILLEQKIQNSPSLTADERGQLILWLNQISHQTVRISELLKDGLANGADDRTS